MSDKPQDRIARLVGYYREVVTAAADLPSEGHGRTLKKVCVVAVIDALAKAIYPTRSNRSRFVRVINEFGGWQDSTRISLPHLRALLLRVPDPDYQALRVLVNDRLSKWRFGAIQPLSEDLAYKEAHKLWPQDKEVRTPLARIIHEGAAFA